MRCLNFWDNKNFWGAKSGPLAHASSVNNVKKTYKNNYYLLLFQTWVMLLGNNGKKVVEDDIGSYVTYYKDCTKADNHAVREGTEPFLNHASYLI